jgi:hypothetical protein
MTPAQIKMLKQCNHNTYVKSGDECHRSQAPDCVTCNVNEPRRFLPEQCKVCPKQLANLN